MNFYIVPILRNILDINNDVIIEAMAISKTKAVIKLNGIFEVKESWIEITEEQFNQYKLQEIVYPTQEITMEELKENQLILMGAIADLYETIAGV
jgi:predicted small secreted protein